MLHVLLFSTLAPLLFVALDPQYISAEKMELIIMFCSLYSQRWQEHSAKEQKHRMYQNSICFFQFYFLIALRPEKKLMTSDTSDFHLESQTSFF